MIIEILKSFSCLKDENIKITIEPKKIKTKCLKKKNSH